MGKADEFHFDGFFDIEGLYLNSLVVVMSFVFLLQVATLVCSDAPFTPPSVIAGVFL